MTTMSAEAGHVALFYTFWHNGALSTRLTALCLRGSPSFKTEASIPFKDFWEPSQTYWLPFWPFVSCYWPVAERSHLSFNDAVSSRRGFNSKRKITDENGPKNQFWPIFRESPSVYGK